MAKKAKQGVTPEMVAQNVVNNVRKLTEVLHHQVYANVHGHQPPVILAALGAKSPHLLNLLSEAALVATVTAAPASGQ